MNDNDSLWDYKPDGQTVQQPAAAGPDTAYQPPEKPRQNSAVVWTASEYIDHTRGAGWYMALITGTVGISGVVYLITKDFFTIGVVIVTGIVIGIFSTHKPKQVQYELSATALKAGEKSYSYTLFKSFTIIRENALSSLNLIPIKRFMPPLSIYFDPAQEQKIVEIVGNHLAYEEGGLDAVEKISRRLRF